MTKEWYLVYLYNMRMPIGIVGTLGVLMCLIIGLWGSSQRRESAPTSPLHTAAVERQMVSLKIGIMLALFTALVWAIPAPDYAVRYVDRPVPVIQRVRVPVFSGVKTVEVQSTYQTVYDKCISSYGYNVSTDVLKQCHDQAIAAVDDQAAKPAVVVKKFIQHDPYKTLFDNCNDNHDAGIQSLGLKDSIGPRNDRIALCHKIALEGSRAH